MSNILARCIERDAYMCSWRIKHQNSIVACSFFPLEKLFSRGSNESSSTPRWRRSIRQRENDLFSIENSNYLLSLVDQSTQLNVKRKTHPKRIFSQETYARISKIKKYHRSRFQYFFSLSRFFSPSANIFTGRRKKKIALRYSRLSRIIATINMSPLIASDPQSSCRKTYCAQEFVCSLEFCYMRTTTFSHECYSAHEERWCSDSSRHRIMRSTASL